MAQLDPDGDPDYLFVILLPSICIKLNTLIFAFGAIHSISRQVNFIFMKSKSMFSIFVPLPFIHNIYSSITCLYTEIAFSVLDVSQCSLNELTTGIYQLSFQSTIIIAKNILIHVWPINSSSVIVNTGCLRCSY